MRRSRLAGHILGCLLGAAAISLTSVSATNPLVPSTGAWVGVSVDWGSWSSANDYIKQAQFTPTSFSIYVR